MHGELWRTLAELDADEPFLRRLVHRCDCDDGPCDNAPESEIAGHTWDRCPYEALRDPYFVVARYYVDVMEVQPLADWPHRYPLGMVAAVRSIQQARTRQRQRQQQQ